MSNFHRDMACMGAALGGLVLFGTYLASNRRARCRCPAGDPGAVERGICGESSFATRNSQPMMGTAGSPTLEERAYLTPALQAQFKGEAARSIYPESAHQPWYPGLDTTVFFNDITRYDISPPRREEAVENMGLFDQMADCNPASTIMDPTVAQALQTDPVKRAQEAQFAGLTPEFLRVLTQDPGLTTFEQIMSQTNFTDVEKMQAEEDLARQDAATQSHFKDIHTQYALKQAEESERWSTDFDKNARALFERQRELGSAVPYSTFAGGDQDKGWVDLGRLGTGYNSMFQVPYA